MIDATIDYGKLVDEAMHVIVFKALKYIEKEGLPGEHHFFISFSTQHPRVQLSKALLEKYQREMTIVLQYQFQNLKVEKLGFSVTLSFSGTKENIYVPFSAITTFADPSVQFGLQFREADFDNEEINLDLIDGILESVVEDGSKKPLQHKSKAGKKSSENKADNVISLDTFRKKK